MTAQTAPRPLKKCRDCAVERDLSDFNPKSRGPVPGHARQVVDVCKACMETKRQLKALKKAQDKLDYASWRAAQDAAEAARIAALSTRGDPRVPTRSYPEDDPGK